MNLEREEVEWFMDVYKVFKGEPNEDSISFRLNGMLALSEDWVEQQNIIDRQNKALAMARSMLLGCGTFVFGLAARKVAKLYRKKKGMKYHKEEFLRKMDEGSPPVVLNQEGAR